MNVDTATGAVLDHLLGLDSRPPGITDADLRWIAKGMAARQSPEQLSQAQATGLQPAYATQDWITPNGEFRWGQTGLTKRELFAAMAMEGLLAAPGPPALLTSHAITAVGAADALLAELAK